MSSPAPPSTPTNSAARERLLLCDLLHDVPFLEEQSGAVIAALAEAAQFRAYPAEGVIFWEREPAEGLFVIESGVVKIARVSTEGREHILHMLKPGDTFNDVAGIGGGLNLVTATAFSEVRAWCICRPALQRISKQYPGLAWALIESLARRARYLMGIIEDLSMRSVRGRLCNLLLEQAQANESNSVPRLMTQQDMAGLLGTVREVVGRALRALANDGIIRFERSRIMILDRERLEEEAATK